MYYSIKTLYVWLRKYKTVWHREDHSVVKHFINNFFISQIKYLFCWKKQNKTKLMSLS